MNPVPLHMVPGQPPVMYLPDGYSPPDQFYQQCCDPSMCYDPSNPIRQSNPASPIHQFYPVSPSQCFSPQIQNGCENDFRTVPESRSRTVSNHSTMSYDKRAQDFKIKNMSSDVFSVENAHYIWNDFRCYLQRSPDPYNSDRPTMARFATAVLDWLGRYLNKRLPVDCTIAILENLIETFKLHRRVLQEIGVKINMGFYLGLCKL